MKKAIKDSLDTWPTPFIKDVDLARLVSKSTAARHGIIKRALKTGDLLRMRKGLYLIASKIKEILPNKFELALLLYEPSIISLESALSYHEWIPEAVYTTTCTSPKRAQKFETPIGTFSYKRVPLQGFYVGVTRMVTQTGVMFVAHPWRALADLIYTKKNHG